MFYSNAPHTKGYIGHLQGVKTLLSNQYQVQQLQKELQGQEKYYREVREFLDLLQKGIKAESTDRLLHDVLFGIQNNTNKGKSLPA
ncbi:MAG: hypothetical protein KTR14_01945 [Vampirovibrio sp.]|nr:hypothetical protein [Vampirovibrio sp.]